MSVQVRESENDERGHAEKTSAQSGSPPEAVSNMTWFSRSCQGEREIGNRERLDLPYLRVGLQNRLPGPERFATLADDRKTRGNCGVLRSFLNLFPSTLGGRPWH
jgi:hypothetical protein